MQPAPSYEHRPSACRELPVTSPPELCQDLIRNPVHPIPASFRMGSVLSKLRADGARAPFASFHSSSHWTGQGRGKPEHPNLGRGGTAEPCPGCRRPILTAPITLERIATDVLLHSPLRPINASRKCTDGRSHPPVACLKRLRSTHPNTCKNTKWSQQQFTGMVKKMDKFSFIGQDVFPHSSFVMVFPSNTIKNEKLAFVHIYLKLALPLLISS